MNGRLALEEAVSAPSEGTAVEGALGLDDPRWAELGTGSGGAVWVPAWLRYLEANPHDLERFNDEWPELSSEGTTLVGRLRRYAIPRPNSGPTLRPPSGSITLSRWGSSSAIRCGATRAVRWAAAATRSSFPGVRRAGPAAGGGGAGRASDRRAGAAVWADGGGCPARLSSARRVHRPAR